MKFHKLVNITVLALYKNDGYHDHVLGWKRVQNSSTNMSQVSRIEGDIRYFDIFQYAKQGIIQTMFGILSIAPQFLS